MSELITAANTSKSTRRYLLTTVSALSLATTFSLHANAEDADRRTVWIELGAQIDHMEGGQELFEPPFLAAQPRPDFEAISPLSTQHLPRYGIDMDGKLSFRPHSTDWVFTAAVRYGRSNGNKHVHQQTPGIHADRGNAPGSQALPFISLPARFDDTKVKHDESHLLLDFSVGKDVGLGLLDRKGQSVINFGARFAQFSGTSSVSLSSNPDVHVYRDPRPAKYFPIDVHHSYRASEQGQHSFRGIGPALSWDASIPVVGNPDDSEITLDWGANGAVLFGRQFASTSHKTHATYWYPKPGGVIRATAFRSLYHHTPNGVARSHSVVVPNIGGFAGISFRYVDAKVSLGYRADIFFGAIDGGIDERKTYDRSFYGPFATISIGLGG